MPVTRKLHEVGSGEYPAKPKKPERKPRFEVIQGGKAETAPVTTETRQSTLEAYSQLSAETVTTQSAKNPDEQKEISRVQLLLRENEAALRELSKKEKENPAAASGIVYSTWGAAFNQALRSPSSREAKELMARYQLESPKELFQFAKEIIVNRVFGMKETVDLLAGVKDSEVGYLLALAYPDLADQINQKELSRNEDVVRKLMGLPYDESNLPIPNSELPQIDQFTREPSFISVAYRSATKKVQQSIKKEIIKRAQRDPENDKNFFLMSAVVGQEPRTIKSVPKEMLLNNGETSFSDRGELMIDRAIQYAVQGKAAGVEIARFFSGFPLKKHQHLAETLLERMSVRLEFEQKRRAEAKAGTRGDISLDDLVAVENDMIALYNEFVEELNKKHALELDTRVPITREGKEKVLKHKAKEEEARLARLRQARKEINERADQIEIESPYEQEENLYAQEIDLTQLSNQSNIHEALALASVRAKNPTIKNLLSSFNPEESSLQDLFQIISALEHEADSYATTHFETSIRGKAKYLWERVTNKQAREQYERYKDTEFALRLVRGAIRRINIGPEEAVLAALRRTNSSAETRVNMPVVEEGQAPTEKVAEESNDTEESIFDLAVFEQGHAEAVPESEAPPSEHLAKQEDAEHFLSNPDGTLPELAPDHYAIPPAEQAEEDIPELPEENYLGARETEKERREAQAKRLKNERETVLSVLSRKTLRRKYNIDVGYVLTQQSDGLDLEELTTYITRQYNKIRAVEDIKIAEQSKGLFGKVFSKIKHGFEYLNKWSDYHQTIDEADEARQKLDKLKKHIAWAVGALPPENRPSGTPEYLLKLFDEESHRYLEVGSRIAKVPRNRNRINQMHRRHERYDRSARSSGSGGFMS